MLTICDMKLEKASACWPGWLVVLLPGVVVVVVVLPVFAWVAVGVEFCDCACVVAVDEAVALGGIDIPGIPMLQTWRVCKVIT